MAYIGNSPGVASQRVETAFTATSNQTAFTPSSGYTLGYCDVYQNGVKLVNGDDYTASDGVTVTLATGAASGDSIVIVASFPRGLSDGYLKSEADAKYLTIANPSYTGTLTGGTGAITIGTNQFVKDSSGNIGIGTASPTASANKFLNIAGASATEIRLHNTGSGATASDGFAVQMWSDANVYLWNYENSATVFGTNGTERARIDSSGKLFVGGPSSSTATGAVTSQLAVIAASSGNSLLTIESTGTAANSNYGIIDFVNRSQASGDTRMAEIFVSRTTTSTSALDGFFAIAVASGGTTNEKFRITSGGNILLNNGIALGNVSYTDGTGIKFPAAQVASSDANTLDDYEEGSFTPNFSGSSTNPTVTYSVQEGKYTKIGNRVYFNILVVLTGVSSQGTGNILVGGLPFAGTGYSYENVCLIGYNDVFDTAFKTAYVSGSSLVIIPVGVTQGNAVYGSPATDSASNLSTGYLGISGFYRV